MCSGANFHLTNLFFAEEDQNCQAIKIMAPKWEVLFVSTPPPPPLHWSTTNPNHMYYVRYSKYFQNYLEICAFPKEQGRSKLMPRKDLSCFTTKFIEIPIHLLIFSIIYHIYPINALFLPFFIFTIFLPNFSDFTGSNPGMLVKAPWKKRA